MVSSMNIGGVEKSLLSLLSVIPRDKYDITILTLEKKGGFLEYLPNWVKVEEANWYKEIKPILMQPPQKTIKGYIKNKKCLKVPSFVYSYFRAKKLDDRYIYYKNILKSIRKNENEYDVAIAYAGPTEIIDTYITHKVKAKKKIGWIHFDVSKFTINKGLYKNLVSKFDKVFVVSEEAKKKLIQEIPEAKEKSEVLLNIVSSKLIEEMANEEIDFDKDFKGTKIVTVGRLSKEKGQDLAIKVLAKLKKDGLNVRWYCVGDGSARKDYENQIKTYGIEKDFILLGSTPNPYPYIKKSDIYVQTSRHEGYCLTLAEAKSLKKPIVTTNFTGAYEQITSGRTGIISECNEEELYIKVKGLIENEEEQKEYKRNLLEVKSDTTNQVKKLFSYID